MTINHTINLPTNIYLYDGNDMSINHTINPPTNRSPILIIYNNDE